MMGNKSCKDFRKERLGASIPTCPSTPLPASRSLKARFLVYVILASVHFSEGGFPLVVWCVPLPLLSQESRIVKGWAEHGARRAPLPRVKRLVQLAHTFQSRLAVDLISGLIYTKLAPCMLTVHRSNTPSLTDTKFVTLRSFHQIVRPPTPNSSHCAPSTKSFAHRHKSTYCAPFTKSFVFFVQSAQNWVRPSPNYRDGLHITIKDGHALIDLGLMLFARCLSLADQLINPFGFAASLASWENLTSSS
ncbi:hypothetical protein CC2G_011672 [Coprinopsis cinerea AmutBmut pab1-1]|nr:hypothetical protein CC2G_011672 [Coprinopsis cinerea AmutBmut pab1-1]